MTMACDLEGAVATAHALTPHFETHAESYRYVLAQLGLTQRFAPISADEHRALHAGYHVLAVEGVHFLVKPYLYGIADQTSLLVFVPGPGELDSGRERLHVDGFIQARVGKDFYWFDETNGWSSDGACRLTYVPCPECLSESDQPGWLCSACDQQVQAQLLTPSAQEPLAWFIMHRFQGVG